MAKKDDGYERTTLIFKDVDQKNIIQKALEKHNKDIGTHRKESFSSFVFSFVVPAAIAILKDKK